ncbi:hypothetical protein IC232_03370 [Microvirga sp. BT688]|uniref:calcium-binding protein n=1 Tax=Microvirga sp. TaxID=1873136 RepID=UPI0016889504|nr:calcium-binding protein [Microvirga sp.]MBD2745729.1 hypothetical protein [Microvirga sp.]
MPADATAPTLNWVTLSATEGNLAVGEFVTTITASVTDDHSGVRGLSLTYVAGQRYLFGDVRFDYLTSVGTVTASGKFGAQPYAARGVFQLNGVSVTDNAGNWSAIKPETALAMGIPTQIVLHDGEIGALLLPTLGADRISGTIHADSLAGFSGNDTFIGGAGEDTIDGGNGIDAVSFLSGSGRVVVDFNDPRKSSGDATGDLYLNVESFQLSNLNDVFKFSGEKITVSGERGNDKITGSYGKDTIYGGAGNDLIDGGGGRDSLYGGAGSDTFLVKEGFDPRKVATIVDFSSRFDTVKLDIDFNGYSTKPGRLKSKQFAYGLKNWNADTEVAYNNKTGDVWFSTSWSSSEGGDGFKLLKLKPNLTLKASDFYFL